MNSAFFVIVERITDVQRSHANQITINTIKRVFILNIFCLVCFKYTFKFGWILMFKCQITYILYLFIISLNMLLVLYIICYIHFCFLCQFLYGQSTVRAYVIPSIFVHPSKNVYIYRIKIIYRNARAT